jgi:uncharacterized protein YuzE
VTFALDGQFLTSDYDEAADILYLWVSEPQPAITYETSQGHLVQLDPTTREFVGVAILDFAANWKDKSITVDIPVVEQRVLEPV